MFEHFLRAQEGTYANAVRELRSGRKITHWMWFVFPQLKRLGRSATAMRFGLTGLEEARDYAAHPILGARLRECVAIANSLDNCSARELFGSPNDAKFRSCLTLFLRATGEAVFRQALEKYYAGGEDPLTIRELEFD
ncbi:MAG: DUF1810 family protein [Alphaproteobacteria bacterium]|nr:DUF1810 family protein [Alphaproteobacteria bacterium]